MKILVLAGVACVLGGCAYPVSSINQGVEPGHVRLAAPVGAGIRVDGRDRGVVPAVTYPLIVDVEPGRHLVEEIIAGQVVLHREYEIGAGSTVELRGGI